MRRLVFAIIGLGLVAVIVIGLTQSQAPKNKAPTSAAPADTARRLAGAPPPLAALHAQANRILPGSPQSFKARLAELKGHPVVVNAWASWCGPCRFEFPFFQGTSVKLGRSVAFVGINVGDNTGDAERFLKRFPVSFPSYEDPSYKIIFALKAPRGLPSTLFYDAAGKLQYTHQGGYPSRAALERDIRRYANPA